MNSERLTDGVEPNACITAETLLIVGPQPPPIGGATVIVQTILDEIAKHNSIQVILVNTSPPPKRFSAKKAGLNSTGGSQRV